MRNLFLSLTLIASLFVSGCSILSKDATVEQRATDVQLLAYTASSIGVAIAVQDNPELTEKFELAYNNLNMLVETKVITGLLLRQFIDTLPIKELKSPNARIAIDGATYLYTASAGNTISIEDRPLALAAATGIRDGMKAALGK